MHVVAPAVLSALPLSKKGIMVDKVPKIRQLPADVAAQIKSSVNIPTLDAVVMSLIQNSLDARAQKINVHADYARGFCQVEDDGDGIEPSEFSLGGGLGHPYCMCDYHVEADR